MFLCLSYKVVFLMRSLPVVLRGQAGFLVGISAIIYYTSGLFARRAMSIVPDSGSGISLKTAERSCKCAAGDDMHTIQRKKHKV